MPKTILQRWENLFGSEAGGNNSPDSLAAKSNGTDGDGLSGTAAISHTNPLNKASALDEGYDSLIVEKVYNMFHPEVLDDYFIMLKGENVVAITD